MTPVFISFIVLRTEASMLNINIPEAVEVSIGSVALNRPKEFFLK
jgi:hypothetical protein